MKTNKLLIIFILIGFLSITVHSLLRRPKEGDMVLKANPIMESETMNISLDDLVDPLNVYDLHLDIKKIDLRADQPEIGIKGDALDFDPKDQADSLANENLLKSIYADINRMILEEEPTAVRFIDDHITSGSRHNCLYPVNQSQIDIFYEAVDWLKIDNKVAELGKEGNALNFDLKFNNEIDLLINKNKITSYCSKIQNLEVNNSTLELGFNISKEVRSTVDPN